MGATSPKGMMPRAQAQKTTQSGTKNGDRNRQQGGRPLSISED